MPDIKRLVKGVKNNYLSSLSFSVFKPFIYKNICLQQDLVHYFRML